MRERERERERDENLRALRMNKSSRSVFLVLTTILMLLVAFVSCADKPNVSSSNTIRFISEIGRKATADSGWSIGDEVGIYMVEAGEDVATVATTDRDNVQYVADTADITFSAFSAADASNPLKWDDISTPAITHFDFIAYYPYVSSIADTTALPIHVYPGSGEQDTGKADFLWGKKAGVQNNTSTVSLTLSHALSRLVVNISPSTTVDKDAITGGTLVATVTGMNTQATIDLDSGDVAPVVPSDIDVVMKDISGTLTEAERTAGKRRYEAVLIPTDNTTALSSLGLRFTLGGETYEWAASSVASSDEYRIVLESGKTHVYNMTLNTAADKVAVAEILIGIVDWNTGSGVNAAATFKPYRAVSVGDYHTMILKTDDTLWATGWNNVGQLGDGTTDDRSTPVPVWDSTDGSVKMTGVKEVSAGGSHTMILKKDGTLWATGDNQYGQLGDGTIITRTTPVQVKASTADNDFMTDVAAVSAGDYHTMILKKDGTLWATGDNQYGQLGDGTSGAVNNKSTPVRVKDTSDGSGFMTDVAAVYAGTNHTMILKNNGTLWATGRNDFGQLGDGTTGTVNNKNTPVRVKDTTDGSGFMTDVAAVSAGGTHTMILKKDGTLWATGSSIDGKLGVGDYNDRNTPVQVSSMGSDVAAVSAGKYHTMIVKKNGTLWATGNNVYGQLGVGDNSNRNTPVPVSSMGSDVVAVSARERHTMILKNDGTLWGTGHNVFGQLGLGVSGSEHSKRVPEQVIL
ncbi:fimbrillin family protein [Parasphaerochaeta coccoides]|uniref:Regulator of chromosome condensation RCC1 n=1 Tax=Parasphaerochaeta coccoides (strain ATCC BAA-1237 / DSM 17374 / SPN1) TaxID=760011 RepID=F4GKR4_PARC1|nr:fimbrillin family protein [Parasphaerochaeta coccoides]AEC01473.1 regulator of chromosome condensation RCC1 [Parasphaerochaeta coccoides DSM 17374]